MPGLYDRIKDTWTITSATTLGVSSTFTVTGTAASGYETFAARYATNEGNIPVAIVSQTANQWMVCWCTYNPTGSTPNLLRIDTVIFSTSGDSSVTFSPATMDVFVTASSRAVPGLRENNTFTGTNNFTGTTSVPFTQSGTGAVARTVDAKLKEGAVSVKDFGAVGNGSTEDHVAIQAAIDYAASSGRTPVFFPAGTYIIGATITLKSKVVLEGESPNTTIIKAKNGLNADMLKTLNYATLTGQNKYLISDGLQYGFGLTNITLDGNKANQTSGNGLVVYGKKYWLDNIVIYNVKEIGWISEGWYNVNTSEFPNEPESVYKNVDVQYCGSHGIRYRGPTDAYWSAIFTHENLGWGVRFETDNATYNAASDCEHIHVYTNTLGGLFNNTKMRFGHVATESNYGEGLVEQGFATSYGYIESYINCRTTGTYAMTFSGGATEVSRLWNADGNQNKSGVLVTGSFVRISSGTLNGGVSPGVGLTLAGSQNHIEATVYGYKGVGGRGVVFGNAGVGLNTSTVNIQCYDNAIGYTVDTQGVRTQGMMSVHALAGQVVAGTAFDTNTGIDVKTLNTDTSASVSQKLAPIGTVSVPGFGFAGETNTGIYRPGANILGITSTGTEVARFINSGSTGFIAIGAANTFASPGGPYPLLQVNRNTAQAGFFAGCWQNSVAAAAQVVLAKSKSGTVNTHALVASGDVLGEIHFTGSGGASGFHPAARISAEVDGTPASNDMPGRLTFWTTPDNAASSVERVRIDNAGNVGIGTPAPATRLHVQETNEFSLGLTLRTDSTQTAMLNHPVALLENANASLGNGLNIRFRIADTGGTLRSVAGIGAIAEAKTASTVSGGIYLYTGTAERMRIDTNGRAIIGNQSAFTAASATYRTYFLGSGTDYPSLVGYTGNSALGARISLAKSRNADWNSFAAVQDGDALGELSFIGADGSNFTEGARISGQVDGTIGASDMPGRLIFSTTPDGSSAAVERMRIDNAGNVGIGTSGALTDKFRVQGSAAVRYFSVLASGKTEIRYNNNLMEGDIFTVANNGISAAAHGAGIRFNLDISNGAGIESAYMRAVATDTYALAANRSAGLAFGTINAGTLAERFRIDGAGNIGIGTAVPGTVSGTTGANVIIFNSISGTPIVLSRNRTDDANASRWFWDKERNGLIVGNGDTLGTFFFRGYDGAAFQPAASIQAQVDGPPGAGDMPGRLIFSTTPDGTASLAERMRITNAGFVGINGTPTSRFHVFAGASSTSGPCVDFFKPRDATIAQRYIWEDCGGLTGDAAGGAYWRGFQLGCPAGGITDPVGGATLFPTASFYYEYNTIAAPTTRRFVIETANDSSTSRHDIVFKSGLADRLNLTGGGNALFSGSVGVNTATLSARLHVEDANSTGVGVLVKNTSTAQNFMGGIGLGNSATANGFNVTIGTAVRDADTTDSYFAINKTNITTNAFVATLAYHDLTDNFWAFHTANAERMRIDSSGNVGIGGSPSAKLDVVSTSNNIVISRSTGGYAAFQRVAPTGNAVYDFYTTNNVERARITSGDSSFFAISTGSSAVEAMRIDSASRVLVGHNASVESITGVATAKLQVSGTDGTSAAAVYRYSADTDGPMFILSKSRGGIGVSAAVSAGDELGAIHFAGAGASGFHRGASIRAIADTGATGAADMPGRLQFLTSADGSATPTERLRITSTGDVVLMNDAGARDVSSLGFRGIPSNERSANYTLALTDAGKAVIKKVATAITITVPDSVAVPFPIGTTIVIDNSHPAATAASTVLMTITPASGVGIIGASSPNKDLATGLTGANRFKSKTMVWPSQTTLRKLRDKGSAVTLTTAPTAGAGSPSLIDMTLPSAHTYTVNDFVIVAGATTTGYNGTHRVVAVPSSTKIQYYVTTNPGGATGTFGTATPADLWVITGDYANSTTA